VGALWFFADPEVCGLAAWWESPLGRFCARFFGTDDARIDRASELG